MFSFATLSPSFLSHSIVGENVDIRVVYIFMYIFVFYSPCVGIEKARGGKKRIMILVTNFMYKKKIWKGKNMKVTIKIGEKLA